jgi:uncharacterized protein YndB with AHSA1/START domain
MPAKGTVALDGSGHATLTFLRAYRHRPELVWEAISTAEGLSEWLLCSRAIIEPQKGGRIELVSGPAQYHSSGVILEWEPPRLLEYEWNVEPVAEMPKGEHAVFRFELSWDGAVTRMCVTYRRMTQETAKGFVVGVHALLERLEAQLSGRTLPDFFARFSALRAEYPEWSHDAPAPRQ